MSELVARDKQGRPLCPGCGLTDPFLLTEDEVKAGKHGCSPIRCDEWKVVGKMTQPEPLTGHRRWLLLVEGGKPDA